MSVSRTAKNSGDFAAVWSARWWSVNRCALVVGLAVTAAQPAHALGHLTFSWRDNSSNETGFRVERSEDGVTFAGVALVEADRTTFTDTTVQMGKRYWYRVAAYNDGGDSNFSPVIDGMVAAVASAENTAPTISDLTDCAVSVGTAVPAIAFTIDDEESPGEMLTLIGNTSNRELVPVENLRFGGSGRNRTLTVTPAANRTGWTTIWVKVSDGELTDVRSFVLVVSAADPNAPRAALVNVSARVRSQPANPVTVGFVVAGAAEKQVLVRAIGPTLREIPFLVSSALTNPRLNLKRLSGSTYVDLAANTDWATGSNQDVIRAVAYRLQALALSDQSRDAALLVDVAPGQYTALADGAGNEAGIALVELYDADGDPATRLINLSTRGHVGLGDDVLICGFVVAGTGTIDVLLRAVGPGLAAAPFHVPDVLADPEIELFRHEDNGDSVAIFRQDNWEEATDTGAMALRAQSTGAFALATGSRDAAAILTLGPGVYTAVVRGVNATTGTALAEIYEVP